MVEMVVSLNNMKASILMLRLQICDILWVETELIFQDMNRIADCDVEKVFNALQTIHSDLWNS